MRNRMYGGVRGRKTKVGEKLLRFPPTRLLPSQRDIVLFLRLSSTLLIGALSLLAKNYFIVKKKAPLFNKETSKF